MQEPILILVTVEGGVVLSVATSLATPGRVQVRVIDHDDREQMRDDVREDEERDDQEFLDACKTEVW